MNVDKEVPLERGDDSGDTEKGGTREARRKKMRKVSGEVR
jgi:hypothetical protein